MREWIAAARIMNAPASPRPAIPIRSAGCAARSAVSVLMRCPIAAALEQRAQGAVVERGVIELDVAARKAPIRAVSPQGVVPHRDVKSAFRRARTAPVRQ